MPHTNRKQRAADTVSPQSKIKKPVHIKRQQIEGDDGWTHVIGDRITNGKVDTDKSEMSLSLTGDFSMNGYHYVNKTLDEIQADYKRYKKTWDATGACTQLKAGLSGYKNVNPSVENVVCLGLGSMQNVHLQFARASYTQLAALSTILEVLGITSVQKIVQDPHFTDLDKTFLKSLGYEVTDDPEAFNRIQSNSMVYAIHCYPNIYQTISTGIHPALIIGNDMSKIMQAPRSDTTTWLQGVEVLVDKYEELLEFPRMRFDFSDTKFYTLKAAVLKEP